MMSNYELVICLYAYTDNRFYHIFRCEGLSPVKCSENQEKLARLGKNCGQLLDTAGPFKECIHSLQDIMNQQFMNCKMEFCIVGASQRGVTCPKLEVAASICAAHGFIVLWRTESFCRKFTASASPS